MGFYNTMFQSALCFKVIIESSAVERNIYVWVVFSVYVVSNLFPLMEVDRTCLPLENEDELDRPSFSTFA